MRQLEHLPGIELYRQHILVPLIEATPPAMPLSEDNLDASSVHFTETVYGPVIGSIGYPVFLLTQVPEQA